MEEAQGVLGGAKVGGAPFREQDEPVEHGEDLGGGLVYGAEDGLAPLRQPLQNGDDGLGHVGVQPRRRLVAEEERGVGEDLGREGQPLRLPTRHAPLHGRVPDSRLRALAQAQLQSQPISRAAAAGQAAYVEEDFLGPAVLLLAGHLFGESEEGLPIQPLTPTVTLHLGIVDLEAEVLANGEGGHEDVILLDVGGDGVYGGADVVPVHADVPRHTHPPLVPPDQRVHQRRLARPAAANSCAVCCLRPTHSYLAPMRATSCPGRMMPVTASSHRSI